MDNRYSHSFHAGNVGDVWKHTVLMALLAALRRPQGERLLVETHAGAGRYELGPTGEWTEGIGKLWAARPAAPPAIARYLALAPPLPPERRSYPGSPLLALSELGTSDRAIFCEIDGGACDRLRAAVGHDRRAEVREGDGLAALPPLLQATPAAIDVLVVIDPPYGNKEDWTSVPDALVACHRLRPATRFLLWYALKSYTRPNAMLQRLGKAGVPAVAMELVTTPLELRRNRLNGSGVLLVGAPEEAVVEAAAAAPVLGRLCATHGGRFTIRSVGWNDPWTK